MTGIFRATFYSEQKGNGLKGGVKHVVLFYISERELKPSSVLDFSGAWPSRPPCPVSPWGPI